MQLILIVVDRVKLIWLNEVVLLHTFNPLDAVTPLGVKRYSVRNAMINIKDIF
jgi:hypothetical protein